MVKELTDTDFNQEVLESSLPVIVDFSAVWCGPCKMYSPIIDKIADKYKDKVKVFKVDVDGANQTAVEYKIFSVPTTVLFKSGKEVSRIPGAVPEATLEKQVKSLLG